MNLRKSLMSLLSPSPLRGEYFFRTLIDPAKEVPVELVDLVLAASARARVIQLSELATRLPEGRCFPDFWPGEHYRLLAGLVDVLKPKVVVEIGTFTGLSSLSMKSRLPDEAKLVTFDLVPWREISETCLREEDFAGGKLEQRLDNLTSWEAVEKNRDVLEAADLFFIDAAKDGKGERLFLENFRRLNFKNNPVLVFDDIKLWKMLRIWEEIPEPKMDITSLGHWTGTGIVLWKPKGETQNSADARSVYRQLEK